MTKCQATLPCTCRQTSSEIETPPGCAMLSIRAAMLTPSPKISPSIDNDIADIDPDAQFNAVILLGR